MTLGPSQPPLPHAFYKSVYLEVIAVVAYIVTIMMTSLMRVSQKLVVHQSKCISAIKRILPPCMHLVFFHAFVFSCLLRCLFKV